MLLREMAPGDPNFGKLNIVLRVVESGKIDGAYRRMSWKYLGA